MPAWIIFTGNVCNWSWFIYTNKLKFIFSTSPCCVSAWKDEWMTAVQMTPQYLQKVILKLLSFGQKWMQSKNWITHLGSNFGQIWTKKLNPNDSAGSFGLLWHHVWVEKCGHFDHKSLLHLTKVDVVKSFNYKFRVQFWTN